MLETRSGAIFRGRFNSLQTQVRSRERRTAVWCLLLAFYAAVPVSPQMLAREQTGGGSAFDLQVLDDGKQLKLRINHHQLGPVCELWCYEGGSFHYGTAEKRAGGSVVFVHRSGGTVATTTFAPAGPERVSMDVVVQGAPEELKKVRILGPCMQFWHSKAFQRRDLLAEFAARCFLYTMRGPVGMLDTARGLMQSYKADAPENNPPLTQWYVPIGVPHPGDIWAFGASGDRPVHDLVGVESRDGKWVAAIGCARTTTLGQGWHDCLHHVPDMQSYFDTSGRRIVHRSMIYVMPNDKRKLLESFEADFPPTAERTGMEVLPGSKHGLTIVPGPRGRRGPRLAFDVAGIGAGAWKISPWGGFIRNAGNSCAWAYPHNGIVDLWVTVRGHLFPAPRNSPVEGRGWTATQPPANVPALAWRSRDRQWSAGLVWENGLRTTAGGEEASGRGRLFVYQGGISQLRQRVQVSAQEWQHGAKFSMPLPAPDASRSGEVRFAPNAETDMTYGLTIVPPWPEGGLLHTNFPEHFEFGEAGHGILRHHDRIPYPWKIAPDGRSAGFEVESPELPGAIVRATAMAEGSKARFTLRLTNRSGKTLERVKPLLCFWYAKLAGFPGKLSDNFGHTYVLLGGKPVSLASLLTSNRAATAKVAYVRGCTQRDCDKFAISRGGLIGRDIDRALIIVQAEDGKRKLAITFTPGKSILSNAVIPCAHADPFFGTVENGASVEVSGTLLFTDLPLAEIPRALSDDYGLRNAPGITGLTP